MVSSTQVTRIHEQSQKLFLKMGKIFDKHLYRKNFFIFFNFFIFILFIEIIDS